MLHPQEDMMVVEDIMEEGLAEKAVVIVLWQDMLIILEDAALGRWFC